MIRQKFELLLLLLSTSCRGAGGLDAEWGTGVEVHVLLGP